MASSSSAMTLMVSGSVDVQNLPQEAICFPQLSPFLFHLAIDWRMKTTAAQRRNRIQWTLATSWPRLHRQSRVAISKSTADAGEDKRALPDTSSQQGLNINKGNLKSSRSIQLRKTQSKNQQGKGFLYPPEKPLEIKENSSGLYSSTDQRRTCSIDLVILFNHINECK